MFIIFQFIIIIIGAILSASFFIYEILKWRSGLKVQDTENCIIVRKKGKHLFRLIYAMFGFISFMVMIIVYVIFHDNALSSSFTILFSLYIIFYFHSCEYQFSERGIQAYPGSINIAWEHIKSWKWLEYKDDVLLISSDSGYLKLKINEKKELVTAFLQKYKNNI